MLSFRRHLHFSLILIKEGKALVATHKIIAKLSE